MKNLAGSARVVEAMIANPSIWSAGFDVDDGRVVDDGVGSVAEGSKQNGSGDSPGQSRETGRLVFVVESLGIRSSCIIES